MYTVRGKGEERGEEGPLREAGGTEGISGMDLECWTGMRKCEPFWLCALGEDEERGSVESDCMP